MISSGSLGTNLPGAAKGFFRTDQFSTATGDILVAATEQSLRVANNESVLSMFEVQGNKFYLKVVEQTATAIVAQSANSTDRTTYTRSASGAYRRSDGQSLEFGGNRFGTWTSADGSQSYQMKRAN